MWLSTENHWDIGGGRGGREADPPLDVGALYTRVHFFAFSLPTPVVNGRKAYKTQ